MNMTHPYILEAERAGMPEGDDPVTVTIRKNVQTSDTGFCCLCQEHFFVVSIGGRFFCLECLKDPIDVIEQLVCEADSIRGNAGAELNTIIDACEQAKKSIQRS
jgi:hypothetical protein